MADVAILGATGPTGIQLASILCAQAKAVRVVSRSKANLARSFPDPAVEKVDADVLVASDALRAVAGCPLVYDCLGFPADKMHLHPEAARSVAMALRPTGTRCVQVSSYWGYLPLRYSPLNEAHPRSGGSDWMRWRREAEDILRDAGAAILHLPDFYGPHVHTSTLQNALVEAAQGKTMNWIGDAATPREYILVSDAMKMAARVADHAGAFGADWVLSGSGPLSGTQVADIASRHLGRQVKVRSAGAPMLRLVSLFNRDLRGFMQMAPDYTKPIGYDAAKLEALIGRLETTPYDVGIGRTLDLLRASARP